jgi:methylisocitrate lyase
MRDYADHYGRITAATDLPVLADADTGFGGVNNVRHTVRAFERAGVAALFIEDQVFPKRCGYFAGKAVVPVEEMVAKIKAALDARRDPDFIIMARTDALGLLGLDAAIERACLYREAGADMTFVQGADRAADLARICREVPCRQLANVSQASRLTTALTRAEMQEAGAAAVTFPIVALLAAARAMAHAMAALHRDGSYDSVQDELMDFGRYAELVGLEAQRAREDGYIEAAKILAARGPKRKG